MKTLQFDGFDWDEGNIRKAQKHGVGLGEIEDFFSQKLLVLDDHRHSHSETRSIAVGSSRNRRTLFVAFTVRRRDGDVLIRVISARYAHRKESAAYEKLKKAIEEKNR